MTITLALRIVALLAAITATATGEYTLARHVGFDAGSAIAPVVAVDAFAVAAFRSGRRWDRAFAVVAMAAGTAGGHVVAADEKTQKLWWIVTVVSALSPVVAWRVHELGSAIPVAQVATPVARPATQVAPRPARATKPAASSAKSAPQPVAIGRPSAEEARAITARLVAANPDVTLAEVAKATQRDKSQASRLRKQVSA